jgi:hypothetical protein
VFVHTGDKLKQGISRRACFGKESKKVQDNKNKKCVLLLFGSSKHKMCLVASTKESRRTNENFCFP